MPKSGFTGFGTGGKLPPPAPLSDRDLKAAAGDTTAILQLIEQHLARLEQKYFESPVEQPTFFSLLGTSSSTYQKVIDLTTIPHNSFILCVVTGTINLFAGEYVGNGQTDLPNFGQWAAGSNVQLFLTLKGRRWILNNPVSSGTTATGSFIPIAL